MVLTKILATGAAIVSFGLHAATLTTSDWPQPRECQNCTRLQFRRLELKLPNSAVGKIFSTGTGALAIELLPPSGDLTQATRIFDKTQTQLRELFANTDFVEAYGIKTPADYFESLGVAPGPEDRTLGLVRHAEGIDSGRSYTRLSRGALTAYVLEASEAASRRIWFVISGDETYYVLAGPMSAALVEAVLANAAAVEMP